MHERGVLTVAPDEASCVVFGIPKEGIRMGGVDPVLPLSEGARSTLAFDRRG
jgi:two-component system chemotaxis response regulator CheB